MRRTRLLTATALTAALTAALVATSVAQPPVAQPPAPKDPQAKDPPPKDAKGEESKKEEPKKFEWPKDIGGKDYKGYLKDLTDPDPGVRELALRNLPLFGPDVRKEVTKPMLHRMKVEKDPAVRMTALSSVAAVGVEDEADIQEAVRVLTEMADNGAAGGPTRLTAVTSLGAFGGKAESALVVLTGHRLTTDPSYEVRKAVAGALGKIGGNEKTGPNIKALSALLGTKTGPAGGLIGDQSGAVRMEAYQAAIILGPPWAVAKDPKSKTPPPARQPDTDQYIANLKKRIPHEKEKQVEIYARLAVMRLEPKEITEENLTPIARIIASGDQASKLHALTALGLLEDKAEKKLKDIVTALADSDPLVVDQAVRTLAALGDAAKPALPDIAKLKDRPWSKAEKEYFDELIKAATKVIEEAKPRNPSPSSSGTTTTPEPTPPPKKP